MGADDLTTALIDSKEKMKDSLKHVAIGFTKLDYEEFDQENYFKDGKIYIDETKETYDALSFGKKGIFSFYGMMNPKLYLKSIQASSKGISGNLKGDGTQLGGTIIVDKKGNVIYKHVQANYSDQPPVDEIINAVENYLDTNKLI